ncbi:transglycosylase SLT domain-containing protein [Belnapia sp. T6]|uniref:Transglycosylase SLT domain-containing protein n=1 Tax=Belnapia mucosa TaxID=2804532 RepID=A0ABS1V6A8_9PROT|nr:transglycosylase SLT domain-containing protein [Belnapia mucosa]MBL6456259.1 transglycosylase SLT domain-containing protein [Belnapia mucosa]
MFESTPRAAPGDTQTPFARRLRPAFLAIAWALSCVMPDAEAEARSARPAAARSQAKPAAAVARPVARPVAARTSARPMPRRQVAARPRPAQQARPAPVVLPTTTVTTAPGQPSPTVAAALHGASRVTGTDSTLLRAIAWQESRFGHRARNSASSARGLMQFTVATWLEVVRDFGPRHGLAREAASLSTDPQTGAITTKRPRDLRYILALRDNPRLSAVMAAERLAQEQAALQAMLGRPAGPTELYATHMLGPFGARRFLTELDRAPGRPAADVLGADSIAANPGVFLERGSGRRLSLAEVHAGFGRMLAEQREPAPLTLAAR